MQNLIDKLVSKRLLSKEEFLVLIEKRNADVAEYLFRQARQVREKNYGKDVYIRGLIELSNYCKNDCLYCGIRKSNAHVSRYRLDKASILDCCKRGHDLGFRTFVLQGGEDAYYNDKLMVDIISTIKKLYSDSAVTLSLGEKKKETYLAYYQAGADRYLLRHETANAEHYSLLHPKNMSSETRKKCLYDLKEIGFQVGSGFMVGSPYQTVEHLAEDLLFLSDLQPHMIGIGPFMSHHETPFADKKNGTMELTLYMLAILRIMLPGSLLPSTTALGSINDDGRVHGILAGANVVMPNLSPLDVREKYMIYDNKVSTGIEAAEYLDLLKEQMREIGYQVVVARGDFKPPVD
ncbi:MAG: [FeFe] hydrogenase H-cluster radical SAM maturase HydE [Bacteroidales bacterium]|jgi:biotin synthase|nr:[FeFe] hydrogenase H-cluster radical SAM maturase HydE [Bacteroidales bacterium]